MRRLSVNPCLKAMNKDSVKGIHDNCEASTELKRINFSIPNTLVPFTHHPSCFCVSEKGSSEYSSLRGCQHDCNFNFILNITVPFARVSISFPKLFIFIFLKVFSSIKNKNNRKISQPRFLHYRSHPIFSKSLKSVFYKAGLPGLSMPPNLLCLCFPLDKIVVKDRGDRN